MNLTKKELVQTVLVALLMVVLVVGFFPAMVFILKLFGIEG